MFCLLITAPYKQDAIRLYYINERSNYPVSKSILLNSTGNVNYKT